MLILDDALNFLGDSTYTRLVNVVLLIAIGYLLYRWVLEPVYTTLRGVWNFWQLRNRPLAFLEITPPKQSEKSPLATQQLFTVLQRLIAKHDVMSLEIVASREQGIRYLIQAAPDDLPTLQKHIASYLSDARFQILEELTIEATDDQFSRAYEIKQARHYAYPLQQHDDLSQSDPIAYITGSMTKLEPGETTTMQMVVTPHHSHWTDRIHNKILTKGYAILDGKVRYFLVSRWWAWVIALIYAGIVNDLKAGLAVAFVLVIVSFFVRKEEPALTAAEQQLYEGILNKLGQPLFKTDIRIFISADSGNRLADLSSGISSSLAPLNVSGFQQLYVPRHYPDGISQKLSTYKLQHRLPSVIPFSSNILAASELSEVYHFPYGTIRTEGMVRSHSRTLPAPLAVKNGNFDVVLGQNNHHGELMPIGLTAAERERHVFIIGGTGNGKTTMLQYAIVQDIQNGKGVAVVDPHGDMAETLLHHIPEERINDIIYFNPDDLEHPIGLNLLELTPGLKGNDLLREKDVVTESVVSVFRKIFSEDDTGGHRIEYVLRNAIQTALYVKEATLFTIYDLLNDPAYRKQVLKDIDDKNLQNFWKQELGKAGDMQKVKMAAGITSKIGRFLFSASAKGVFEQPHSTINFDEILDGKILICNFSKGLLGEDTSELFGVAILAKLQLAALRRARLKQANRKPFYLYVDEFQNFATPSFVQLLSEARKYKFYLTMAEQSTSQQDDQQMVNIILANVGTVICFRSGNPADEKLVLPLFEPYIEKGEIANLPSYNFYMRIAAKKSQEPFSGETIVLESNGKNKVANEAIVASRKNHAIEYRPPEAPKVEKPAIRTEQRTKAKPNPKSPNKLIPKKKRIS